MNRNIFSDLRKPGLVPVKSLSLSTNINSVLEKNQIYIASFIFILTLPKYVTLMALDLSNLFTWCIYAWTCSYLSR